MWATLLLLLGEEDRERAAGGKDFFACLHTATVIIGGEFSNLDSSGFLLSFPLPLICLVSESKVLFIARKKVGVLPIEPAWICDKNMQIGIKGDVSNLGDPAVMKYLNRNSQRQNAYEKEPQDCGDWRQR